MIAKSMTEANSPKATYKILESIMHFIAKDSLVLYLPVLAIREQIEIELHEPYIQSKLKDKICY